METITLNAIRLAGWKSIKDTGRLELGPLNVFIGANGSGKSNLVSFFKLLHEMIGEKLQIFIATSGGADSVLHYGAKVTRTLEASLEFTTEAGTGTYSLRLGAAAADTLSIWREQLRFGSLQHVPPTSEHIEASGSRETSLVSPSKQEQLGVKVLRPFLASCRVYQFHDTSGTARIRQHCYVEDNRVLRHDGANLAAFLYRLRGTEPFAYRRIVETVRQVAPFFHDFDLEPSAQNPTKILLNWREKDAEGLCGPHQISDGTLRAMALISLLLQPEEDLPRLLVIDEPELGLHPYAIGVIAALVKKASHHCQVILATQSAGLLDYSAPGDVVVVDRKEKASEFRRLSEEDLAAWLEDYSLSEVWEKNVFGGGPH
jgi:predicted ATPase